MARSKREWMALVSKLNLEFFDWLNYLPINPPNGIKPLPMVHVESMRHNEVRSRLNEMGLDLIDSTVLELYPRKGRWLRAIGYLKKEIV